MELPVLIEPTQNNGFRASTGEPLGLCAEGTSKQEALGNLQALLNHRLQHGVELATITVGSQRHPFADFKGIFEENDPLVQEWLEIIEENRRKDDEEEGIER